MIWKKKLKNFLQLSEVQSRLMEKFIPLLPLEKRKAVAQL